MNSLYYFFVDLFRLWMDSIHCYSRLEEDKHDDNERTTDEHDPPVIIIGTWKDAVSSDVEEVYIFNLAI